MIQDSLTYIASGAGLAAIPPLATNYFGASFGLDLNPDYGVGAQPRRSPLPGMGQELLFRVDINSAFTGTGDPVAQFHIALSTSGEGVAISAGTMIIIGSNIGPTYFDLTKFWNGFRASQLTAGTHFFIRTNPWTANMGRDAVDAVVEGKTLRYLGLLITMPNYLAVAGPSWTGGLATAHLVTQGDIMQNPKDFAYPTGFSFKG